MAAENVWKEILNEVEGDVSLEVTETAARTRCTSRA